MSNLIIAVDGPSGAGKSTVSKLLAERLNLPYIDTGAMYRAVALKSKQESVNLKDSKRLGHIAATAQISFRSINGENHTFLDDVDVSSTIRNPEITHLTSIVSAIPEVRESLLLLQRKMAKESGAIMDGRDIGTVVFPNADFKFYIDADLNVRGERRHLELKGNSVDVGDLKSTVDQLGSRDKADSERSAAPLKRADDAIYIDTTKLNASDVALKMETIILNNEESK